MSRQAYYFPHDSNARNDPKIIRLRRQAGLEGYGLYWCVIEILRDVEGHRLELNMIDDIIYELRIDKKVFEALFVCDLLKKDEQFFWSDSLVRRMEKINRRREAAREAGRISAGNRNKSNGCSTNVQRTFNERSTDVQRTFNERSTNAERTFNESGTNVQPKKENKIKENKIKENKIKKHTGPQSDIDANSTTENATVENQPLPPKNEKTEKANPWAVWIDVNRELGREDPLPIPRDCKTAKELGKIIPDPDKLKQIFRAYLEDKEPFLLNNGHGLVFLTSRVNKYLNRNGNHKTEEEELRERGFMV